MAKGLHGSPRELEREAGTQRNKWDALRATTDADLLVRVAARDIAAMRELHDRYSGRLRRFLARLTSRSGVLEEVVNDTFMAIWTKAHQFRGEAQVSTWILGIAQRRGLKRVVAESRAQQMMRTAAESFSELVDDAQTEHWLGQALAALPVKQRVALELAHLAGLSCEEIGVLMRCPVSTVKTRMHYGRRSLQAANGRGLERYDRKLQQQ